MKSPLEVLDTRSQSAQYKNASDRVGMTVYPRVHMFPIDLSLISGIMKNGSFGYSLLDMPIEISVRNSSAQRDSIRIDGAVDIENLDLKVDFNKLRSYIKTNDYYDVTVSMNSFLREHTGLGMSTQILGGIYLCSAQSSGHDLKIKDIYNLGLGHHSALGLNLLFNPGMIFEVGTAISKKGEGIIANPGVSSEYESVANTVYKVNQFPFYSVVAIPKKESSVTDQYGDDFFNDTLPTKNDDAYRAVYAIFEAMIPAIVESNYDLFIESLEQTVGLGIKRVEEEYQTSQTKEVLSEMRKIFGFSAVSSLGPTLYAFSEHDPQYQLGKFKNQNYDYLVYEPFGKMKQTNNDKAILIAGFAAMGKTTFAKNNPDIALDIESIHYERQYVHQDPDDEIAKNDKNWTKNPDYPANYIRAVVENMEKYKVIFLTLAQPVLGELDKLGIEYSILYPGSNRKQQILTDAKHRGNDEDFVAFLDGLLSTPDHRIEFEGFNHSKFEIIDDDTYMEHYLKEKYNL